jgi:Ser/Thr protein kinase RdoA (MazF antagonist)
MATWFQSGALHGSQWQRNTAALVRGHASVRRLAQAEIEALPELLASRSAGSVLWRAGRWRRGQAQLGDVTDRLGELGATLRWLAAHGGQLQSLMASGAR